MIVIVLMILMVVSSLGLPSGFPLCGTAGSPLRSFVILVSTLDTLGISLSASHHGQLSDSSSRVLALSSHGKVLVLPPPSAPSTCLARSASLSHGQHLLTPAPTASFAWLASLSHGQFLVLLYVSVLLLALTSADSASLAFGTPSLSSSSPHG